MHLVSPHPRFWPLLQEILMVLFSFSLSIMLKKPNRHHSPCLPAPQQCHPSAWVRISVTEQFITKRKQQPSSMGTAHGQQGPHQRKKSAITNYSTTQRKHKGQISHLQPHFILKPLPQQWPFLIKLQFRMFHILHCNPNGRGLFGGGASIIIFICTDLTFQFEMLPSGKKWE